MKQLPDWGKATHGFQVAGHINVPGKPGEREGSRPPCLALCISSIRCFLSYSLYNKLVTVSKVLS